MVPHHTPPPLGSANKVLTTTLEDAPKCPRCDSSNTKFCYYNNYSLSQPRYFCKGCKRYWTKGGSLRNVPVGGGVRSRNRRGKFIRPPMNGPLRPDMMLDHHDGLYNETDHGSTDIDLAALYNKFLNQGHENSSRVVGQVGCDDQLVLDGVGNENDLLWSSCPILGGSGSMWMQQSEDVGNGLLCSSLFGGNWSGLDYSGSTFEPFSTT